MQPCVFSVPKCTKVLERTIKACGVRLIFRNLCLNISENACSRAFLSAPKCTKGTQRTIKACGVRIIFRNLCLNISENACSRAFLAFRSVQGYSRERIRKRARSRYRRVPEFTELIDISRSRVKIMLEVAVGGVEQRLGNLALGPEL